MIELFLIARKLVEWSLTLISFFLSPIFKLIAYTGYGTDFCLRQGFLPLPVHYYSPVPDVLALEKENYWGKPSDYDLPGINFEVTRQIELVDEIGRKYADECQWPDTEDRGQTGYYGLNPSFGYLSACLLYCMIRKLKPSRVIEVGAGYSTLIAAQALERNFVENNQSSEFVTVDPYPSSIIRTPIPGLTELLEKRVEKLPISFFDSLGAGDLLFIDSSHVVRAGGDVNFLYLHVLPGLRNGVVVHIHDIQFPFEYPREYFVGRKKYLWTEQYLLQAFLSFNNEFEIVLAAYWLGKDNLDILLKAFPGFNPDRHRISSSFYIRRICNDAAS